MKPPKYSNITLYERLQVHANADPIVIDAAAKALLKKHHPDLGGDINLTKRILEAKGELLDPKKRAAYDAYFRKHYDNQIGNYRVVRKISEGGFGRVFEAVHTTLGEKVCIKQNINISAEDTDLFMREARSIWDLRHHALPAMRDMYQLDDGSCALVMSFIEGPTLEQVVKKYQGRGKEIDPENVAWISQRVLDALRYVHYHGVVHGDVKPQNIIVQPEEHTCALVDFGLSLVKPNSASSAGGYTPLFAAPESYRGTPLIPESDLYSLGLTMIYALGGDVSNKRVPKSTPPNLANFIGDLIRYDVSKRPHWDEVDLVHKLRSAREKDFGRTNTNFKKL